MDNYPYGLHVAKCNLGKVKHEAMLASSLHHESFAGQSWGLAGPW